MDKLSQLLAQIEETIPFYAVEKPLVSGAPVGWHIAHSLLTINVIITAVMQSNPADYKYSFNIKRTFVLVTGKIPRGKIKAPNVVQPGQHMSLEGLSRQLQDVKEKYSRLNQLQAKHHFIHPFLGRMHIKSTRHFLFIHTKHHLDIIKDMLKT